MDFPDFAEKYPCGGGISVNEEQRYWKAVQDALVNNHSYPAAKAYLVVTNFRGEWETQANNPEIIYHEEPEVLAKELHESEVGK